MKVVTYEGFVENGCVHVPPGVKLPEKAKVYVVIPDASNYDILRTIRISSPRLANPEDAKKLVMEVLDVKEFKNE
jgi:hypothetical protein